MQVTNKQLFGIHLFRKKSPCLESTVKSCLPFLRARPALAIFARVRAPPAHRTPLVPWRSGRGQLHGQTEQMSD
jgi:hypothetical protein